MDYRSSISEEHPSIRDESVLEISNKYDAVLLTKDKDFGEFVFRLQLPNKGIVLIRMKEPDEKVSMVTDLVLKYLKDIKNRFSVISNKKLRIKEIN